MFSTFKLKLLLGVYVFILLSIPIGAYLASQQQTFKSQASEKKETKKEVTPIVTPKPTSSAASAARRLLDNSAKKVSLEDLSEDSTPSSSLSTTTSTSYGPTLALKIALEGRPKENQATRLFVGILEGTLTANPKFLLSFTVDAPASGLYSELSLAGLNVGSRYTALLKGSAQIATSSAFTMAPAVTNLNSGESINLLSGDLNDDNVINNADYFLVQKVLGTTPKSNNWNDNMDLNKDGIINTFDLSFIVKNMGKTGDSGAWTSPIPQVSTSSASLTPPAVGGPLDKKGYWLWLPQ